MPKVSRSRTIRASAERVWDLVSDPHNLPRWWPRIMRVEDVQGQGERSRWTAVLETERGTGVRADYRCSGSTNRRRFAWRQDLDGLSRLGSMMMRWATRRRLDEALDGIDLALVGE